MTKLSRPVSVPASICLSQGKARREESEKGKREQRRKEMRRKDKRRKEKRGKERCERKKGCVYEQQNYKWAILW